LPRLGELAYQTHRVVVSPEVVDPDGSTWDDQGVVVVGRYVCKGLLDLEGTPGIEVVVHGLGFAGLGAENVDARPGAFDCFLRIGELDLFGASLCEKDRDRRVLERVCHDVLLCIATNFPSANTSITYPCNATRFSAGHSVSRLVG